MDLHTLLLLLGTATLGFAGGSLFLRHVGGLCVLGGVTAWDEMLVISFSDP